MPNIGHGEWAKNGIKVVLILVELPVIAVLCMLLTGGLKVQQENDQEAVLKLDILSAFLHKAFYRSISIHRKIFSV